MTESPEVDFTFVDGRDALAFVIIRRDKKDPAGLDIEAAANGLTQKAAAYVLRHVADRWDPKP